MTIAMLPSDVMQSADEVERFINYWQAETLEEALACAREYDLWLEQVGKSQDMEDLRWQ